MTHCEISLFRLSKLGLFVPNSNDCIRGGDRYPLVINYDLESHNLYRGDVNLSNIGTFSDDKSCCAERQQHEMKDILFENLRSFVDVITGKPYLAGIGKPIDRLTNDDLIEFSQEPDGEMELYAWWGDMLDLIQKKDISVYDKLVEIGSGSFGAVYKDENGKVIKRLQKHKDSNDQTQLSSLHSTNSLKQTSLSVPSSIKSNLTNNSSRSSSTIDTINSMNEEDDNEATDILSEVLFLSEFLKETLIQCILSEDDNDNIRVPKINEVFYTENDGKITLGINMNKLDADLHKLTVSDKFLENRGIRKLFEDITKMFEVLQEKYRFSHGDVKLDNFMATRVKSTPLVYLIDFGFSQLTLPYKSGTKDEIKIVTRPEALWDSAIGKKFYRENDMLQLVYNIVDNYQDSFPQDFLEACVKLLSQIHIVHPYHSERNYGRHSERRMNSPALAAIRRNQKNLNISRGEHCFVKEYNDIPEDYKLILESMDIDLEEFIEDNGWADMYTFLAQLNIDDPKLYPENLINSLRDNGATCFGSDGQIGLYKAKKTKIRPRKKDGTFNNRYTVKKKDGTLDMRFSTSKKRKNRKKQ